MSKRSRSLVLLGALWAATLAGCTSGDKPRADGATPSESPAHQPTPSLGPVAGMPPPNGGTTLLVVAATTGSREVGSVNVGVGDLWLTGRCMNGTMKLRIEPLGVFPVPCDDLAGVPFAHQIVIDKPTTYRVQVEAPSGVSWNLRVEQ